MLYRVMNLIAVNRQGVLQDFIDNMALELLFSVLFPAIKIATSKSGYKLLG